MSDPGTTYTLAVADDFAPGLTAYQSQPAPDPGLPLQDVFRAAMTQMAEAAAVSSSDEMTVEDASFTAGDGAGIALRTFTPTAGPSAKPLLYWIHGGGTISGLPAQEDSTLYALALELGCVIVSVDYRLTPENPYPVPINDCYEGLLHVTENAAGFGIDLARVAVGGGSAGGLLSTSCAVRARDLGGPRLVHQSLTYPMLDHRDDSVSNKEITDLGVWDSGMNHYGFASYLRGVDEADYPAAVPALFPDLAGLPDTYLAVGTLDCLRDDAITYAQRLAAAGVQTELHIYPGVTHVFDGIAPAAKASRDLWATRIAALRRAFDA